MVMAPWNGAVAEEGVEVFSQSVSGNISYYIKSNIVLFLPLQRDPQIVELDRKFFYIDIYSV